MNVDVKKANSKVRREVTFASYLHATQQHRHKRFAEPVHFNAYVLNERLAVMLCMNKPSLESSCDDRRMQELSESTYIGNRNHSGGALVSA
jgi:hypothetical protein